MAQKTNITEDDIKRYNAKLDAQVQAVTSDAGKLASMIVTLKRDVNNINARKALIAAGTALHAIEHNQVTPLRDMYEALQDSERRDAFVKWAVNYAPVKWEKDKDTKRTTFFFDNTRSEGLRALIATDRNKYIRTMLTNPYWVFAPAPEVKPFSFDSALMSLIKRATKAKADGTFTGNETLLADVVKLGARLTA